MAFIYAQWMYASMWVYIHTYTLILNPIVIIYWFEKFCFDFVSSVLMSKDSFLKCKWVFKHTFSLSLNLIIYFKEKLYTDINFMDLHRLRPILTLTHSHLTNFRIKAQFSEDGLSFDIHFEGYRNVWITAWPINESSDGYFGQRSCSLSSCCHQIFPQL